MNLTEFRNTATRHETAAACEILGVDLDYYAESSTVAVWIYDEACYIDESTSGEFCLTIGRDGWTGTREELEARLYFEHYVTEALPNEDKTLDKLTELFEAWGAWKGIELASADEMRAELGPDHPVAWWLDWFIREWEDAEARSGVGSDRR